MIFSPDKILCVLYSSGGTADVGRHAVRAALDSFPGRIRILTRDPQTLEEKNWGSACGDQSFTQAERDRMDVRAVNFATVQDLAPHLEGVGGVVSGIGNRQPFHGDHIAAVGSKKLVKAMEASGVDRLVAITSAGCNEDWPPMEFHWAGGILKWLFRTVCRKGYQDLSAAERIIRQSSLDYLLVRPVGLGEERRPKGEWFVQKKKYEDKLGPDMSKMDCARFAVSQVLEPTYHKDAVVVGSNWETFQLDEPKEEEPPQEASQN